MQKYEDFKDVLPAWVNKENFELYKMRHTTEHVLQIAIGKLYPDVKRAMGPAIEDGLYFDFDLGDSKEKISEEDFPKIEAEMKKIVKQALTVTRKDVSLEEAKKLFKDNQYKQEFIEEFAGESKDMTVYWIGEIDGKDSDVDLCKGPHVDNTKEIGHFKLLSVAGAYWRGDEKNKMLTRIYATTFKTKEELDEYLWKKEEAKKRDHRKLAKELDLIVFSELVGSGLPMYTPRGTVLRSAVYNYSRELNKRIGYNEVATPNFNRAELFKISGHYDKYKADMLKVISQYSDEEMYFKPMNCPQHTQLFASQLRSYRDLPYRVADFSNLARDERPGEMNGILRSRIFTQDDGHCFCREDQIKQEFKNVAEVIREALKVYGLNYKIRLSLWDPENKEKYLGEPAVWEKSQQLLKDLLNEEKYEYFEGVGEAAIYGPKMDFIAIDAIGREWQISTIQLDFIQPERFKLEYTTAEGTRERPTMIHRAIVGSERFLGIIIEHFAGAFPAWLSPDQVAIIPISQEQNDYAQKIEEELKALDVRVVSDLRNEKMQAKIKDAQAMKIPYMLVVGGREEQNNQVSIRYRDQNQEVMNLEDFKSKLVANIKTRNIDIKL